MKSGVGLLVLAVLCFSIVVCQAEHEELLYHQGLYEERVTGNLAQAVTLYQEILKHSKDRDLRAKVTLRMGICYEKMGEMDQAIALYQKIADDYPDQGKIQGYARSRLQETEQHNQITQLKRQLQQLEESVATEDTKREQISKTLSEVLLDLGKNLYQKGHLRGAKESLKKALFYDVANSAASQLLQKIEKEITLKVREKEQETETEMSKSEQQAETGKEQDPSLLFEKEYDLSELIPFAKLSNLALAKERFQKLLSHQIPALKENHALQWQEQMLQVKHSQSVHQKIAQVIASLRQTPYIFPVRMLLLSASEKTIQQQLYPLHLEFEQAEGGIFFTSLPSSQAASLWEQEKRQNFSSYLFATQFLLENNKGKFEKSFEVPLLKEYLNGNLNFSVYQEGIRFVIQPNLTERTFDLNIFAKKIKRPVEEIPDRRGFIQTPFFIQQSGKIEANYQASEAMIVMGLINPLPVAYSLRHSGNREEKRLLALLQYQLYSLQEFLSRPEDAGWPVFSETQQQQKKTQAYSVETLQEIEDLTLFDEQISFQREDRNSFIQRLVIEYLELAPEEVTMKIIANQLLVHGDANVHQKIAKLLSQLEKGTDRFLRFEAHVFSSSSQDWQKFLQNWSLSPKKKSNTLALYNLSSSYQEMMSKFQQLESWQKEYSFANFIVGNTQNIELVDVQMHTFFREMVERESQENFLYAKVDYLPEGMVLQLRPVILSSEQKFIEINTSFFQVLSANEFMSTPPSKKTQQGQVSLTVERGYAKIPCHGQGEQAYLLANFMEGEEGREYVLVIYPQSF